MSHSPRLFMRPLAVQPAPVPLNVTGTPPKYLPDLQYLTRLPITGGVGKFKADVVSSNNLHPSAQIYVDNVTKELVIRWPPFKTNPPVLGLVRNGNFTDGLNYWDAKTPGWVIGSGQGGTDFPVLEFPGTILGEGYIDSEQVPCLPGDQINFGCEVQQGASAAGNASGQSALVFINLAGEETVMRGTIVDDGANREWHPSRLVRTAPADARYVRGRLYGKRARENKSVFFRNVTWDHAYSSGNNGTLPVDLTVRVSDSMNTSVTKSYIILPYGAVKHFVGWAVAYDLGVGTSSDKFATVGYDPVSQLFCMCKVNSASLFTSPDGITWTEMTSFFPTVLQPNATTNFMRFNPARNEMVVTGFNLGQRGYRFTVAGGAVTNSNLIGSVSGLANAGAVTVTGATNTYSIFNAGWTTSTSGSLPEWRNAGVLEKPGTDYARLFYSATAGQPLASYTMTRADTSTAALTRVSSQPEGFPSGVGAPTTVSALSLAWGDDLGFGLALQPLSTGTSGVWQIMGKNDVPVRIGTLPQSPVAVDNAGKCVYVPWAGEWIRDINTGTVATPRVLVGDMSGTSWTFVQSATVAFDNSGVTTREMVLAPEREALLYHCARYIYRAIFQ